MKRWYLAAVAGLCSIAPASAQEGTLAPTAPVVPAPVVQNGNLLNSGGGVGSRPFSLAKWSPLRNPATANTTEPIMPSAATYGQMVPPPAVVGAPDGSCGPGGCGAGGCGAGGRDRSCWSKLKAWMTYHPSNTDLPRCRPTPYVTPLIGMFPCTPYGGAGCATGCGAAGYGDPTGRAWPPPPPVGQPISPPQPYNTQPMPQPSTPGSGAGAVTMPPRGSLGYVQPTWQGRVTPAPAGTGIAGYRFATPENPVVTTGLKVPAPK